MTAAHGQPGASGLSGARRAFNALRAAHRAVAEADTLAAVLEAICRVAVEEGGYRFAWAGYPQRDQAKSVVPVVWFGDDGGYLERTAFGWSDEPLGRGPVGEAIRRHEPVVADLLRGDRTAPWRQAARSAGFNTCMALPLLRDDEPIAVLAVYSEIGDAFGSEEAALLAEMVDDAACGAATLDLRRAHERLRAILEATPDFVAIMDPSGIITYCNPAAVRILGFATAGELIGSELNCCHPPWAVSTLTSEAIPTALEQGHWQGETSLLASDGEEIPVSQTLIAHHQRDRERAYLSTIIRDLRPHKRSEAQIRASEAIYRRIIHTAREGFRVISEQLESPASGAPARFKVPVQRGETTLLLDVDEVCYVRAEGHYSHIHTQDEAHLSSQPFSQLVQRLQPLGQFLQTHRGHLVNLDYVDALERSEGQLRLVVRNANRDRIPVSRRRTEGVRAALGLE